MAYSHTPLYSWYNTTVSKAFYWEDKELLDNQRGKGENCINVESDITISKKQMRKGPSEALKRRINKK